MTARITSGQRVQHVGWLWEGAVTAIEGDRVHVKLDSGDRETVPAAALRVIRPAQAIPKTKLRGLA